MRKDNEIVSHPGADRCSELADRLLVVAEKELPAFVRAVEEIFGVEQACVSTMDWIEELELIDWSDGAAKVILLTPLSSMRWRARQDSNLRHSA